MSNLQSASLKTWWVKRSKDQITIDLTTFKVTKPRSNTCSIWFFPDFPWNEATSPFATRIFGRSSGTIVQPLKDGGLVKVYTTTLTNRRTHHNTWQQISEQMMTTHLNLGFSDRFQLPLKKSSYDRMLHWFPTTQSIATEELSMTCWKTWEVTLKKNTLKLQNDRISCIYTWNPNGAPCFDWNCGLVLQGLTFKK